MLRKYESSKKKIVKSLSSFFKTAFKKKKKTLEVGQAAFMCL